MPGEKKHDRKTDDERQEQGGNARLEDEDVAPSACSAVVFHHTLDAQPPA
jgi:hypothetical protein